MEYKCELYFGEDIVINDYITIKQPTVRDILTYTPRSEEMQNAFGKGESAYYKMISLVCSTPADFDVQLDEKGIRYEDVKPIDFFFMLAKAYKITSDLTYPLFGDDIDFSSFDLYEDTKTHRKVYMNDKGHKIDGPLYRFIIGVIREMHGISENKTKWANEASRQQHMQYERNRIARHHNETKSVLLPSISMAINNPGYKYNRDETLNLNVFFFNDCLKQLNHYNQADHLMTGVYVGLIDTKKINNLDESLSLLRKDI